jgi:uncharacterized protein
VTDTGHVAVLYRYGPDTDALHAQHGDAHVAFLQHLQDTGILLLSGSANLDGARGALLVLAATADQAVELLNADPFWQSNVVTERQFWPWRVVFGADRLTP